MKSFIKPSLEFKNTRHGGDYYILYPEYLLSGRDIMMKGGKFYAVLNPETNMWSTDQGDLYRIIDKALYSYAEETFELADTPIGKQYVTIEGVPVKISTLDNSSNQRLRALNIWLHDLAPNHNYHPLDSDLTFKGDEVEPEDYRSKTLSYVPKEGDLTNYNTLLGTLYTPNERQKIEWAIGSILAGDSKKIEKMIVIFGSPGSGKSTVLDLINRLFEGYVGTFSAADLADRNDSFSTEMFRDNPLVMIQDDGTMSKIDSPKINEIISHKKTIINEKGIRKYTLTPLAMCFMATNDPVDIRDTNLGIARRVLDTSPSGKTLKVTEYRRAYEGMMREIPAIAKHCLDVYESLGREYYISYVPREMIVRTNYIWNFIDEDLDFFLKNDPVRRDDLYSMYKEYIENAGIKWSLNKIEFTSKMKEYYKKYSNEHVEIDGKKYKNVFSGFKLEKMYYDPNNDDGIIKPWLKFDKDTSIFDKTHKDCPAQYEIEDEDGTKRPAKRWANVDTKLKDLDTSKTHFVKIPQQEIIMDFDYQNENGEKDFEKNYKEAMKWPETYAELSKSGGGIHSHYIYEGDINELKTRINKFVEVKIFPEDKNSSLRRRLTKCNGLKIAKLVEGDLPLKEKKGEPMLNEEIVRNDEKLHSFIIDCMKKKHHGATAPEIDFMNKVTTEYYNAGVPFDIRDLRPQIIGFAAHSSHQSKRCMDVVSKMHYCSEDLEKLEVNGIEDNSKPIIFFDCEVFPNLLLVCWKYAGDDKKVVRMFNPTPSEVEELVNQGRLIGFNNRKYDNHILYARMNGYSIEAIYELSKRIIGGDMQNLPGLAYSLSYADIYDYLNGDGKMSLKKWEIKLGIHHQELGLPWDEPVAKELWEKVAEYCDNDVIATEKVFEASQADFIAREILADIAGKTVNDTTNTLTQTIIFGNDRNPQSAFVYTNLAETFPGYTFDNGVSTYRGEVVGEGGYVYAEPGMYYNVALLDIASMHPTSLECLNLFGRYTRNFSEIKQARIFIKHGDYESAGKLFDGKLKPYLTDKSKAKDLAFALKIAINSVYGLTSAKFENRCRDPRNVDNIVAKRGALFMVNLKHEVQERGFTVAHIKTDSIKIPNATPEIIQFVMDYGKQYGYTFEHEATYEKMCLVNDAVYIAKYDAEHGGEWTATGKEFAVPFIFKSLFSREDILFKDLCETKTVQSGEMYLDMNEGLAEGEHNYKFIGKVGSFCPIAPGHGGGELMVLRNDKYVCVSGTKGWRWMDSEDVEKLGKEDDIDMEYFQKMCEDAIKHINEFGNFEEFAWGVNCAPREDFMNKPIE